LTRLPESQAPDSPVAPVGIRVGLGSRLTAQPAARAWIGSEPGSASSGGISDDRDGVRAAPAPQDRNRGSRAINFLAGIIKRGARHSHISTAMKHKTANIDIRVEPWLVERIDAWRARQRVPPSRSAAVVYMLDQFLEQDPPELNAAWKRLLSKA
jgi:hypothetical protein